MALTTVLDIVFAAGIGVAALAVVGTAGRKVSRGTLVGLALLELAAALAAWIFFALRHQHERELAVAAGGLTGCLLAAAGALLLSRALLRADAIDTHLEHAKTQLRALVQREAEDRAAELERTLARARADSSSLLVEEERRIADDHRRDFVERERQVGESLTAGLTATQAQVE